MPPLMYILVGFKCTALNYKYLISILSNPCPIQVKAKARLDWLCFPPDTAITTTPKNTNPFISNFIRMNVQHFFDPHPWKIFLIARTPLGPIDPQHLLSQHFFIQKFVWLQTLLFLLSPHPPPPPHLYSLLNSIPVPAIRSTPQVHLTLCVTQLILSV